MKKPDGLKARLPNGRLNPAYTKWYRQNLKLTPEGRKMLEKQYENQKKYRLTEKGKIATARNRERTKAQRRTPKGREKLRRYNNSEAARITRMKYQASAKGKAARQKYLRNIKNPADYAISIIKSLGKDADLY